MLRYRRWVLAIGNWILAIGNWILVDIKNELEIQLIFYTLASRL